MRWLYLAGLLSIVGTFIADVWLAIDYDYDGDIALIFLALVVTTFAFLYLLRSNWRAYRVGVVFSIKSVFLSLVVIHIALSVWWPNDYPFRPQVRFAIYTAGAWAYGAMVLQLLREQKRDRDDRRMQDKESSDNG